MKMNVHVCILIVIIFYCSLGSNGVRFYPDYPFHRVGPVEEEFGTTEPLFLTPLIESGDIAEAVKLSAVTGLDTKLKSHSGLITVNKQHGGHMFFWYFPSQRDPDNDPIIMWLEGGPGGSGMVDLFIIQGPLNVVDKELHLEDRELTWNKNYSMIYMDNPVGVGYSFCEDEAAFVVTEDEVGRDLFDFSQQFFTMFPDQQKNDFYISGESYGGKYVPALGYYIHKHNNEAKVKINLKGLLIGNGLSHPLIQFNYGEYFQNVGLIDSQIREEMDETYRAQVEYMNNGDYASASQLWYDQHEKVGELIGSTNLWYDHTSTNIYVPEYFGYHIQYVTRQDVKDAIHVGHCSFTNQTEMVRQHLLADMSMSVADWVQEMLDADIRMIMYDGQLDVICNHVGVHKYLKGLKWKHTDEFNDVSKQIWMLDGKVAGYVHQVEPLIHITVRTAGHTVPTDQPERALDMLDRFVHQRPWS